MHLLQSKVTGQRLWIVLDVAFALELIGELNGVIDKISKTFNALFEIEITVDDKHP